MHKLLRPLLLILAAGTFFASSAQVKKPVAKKKPVTAIKKPVVKTAPVVMPVKDTATYTRVKIMTDMGDMVVKLYNKTPQHRDNFIKLVESHFYDSLSFHRVIQGFMIQGGDPNSKIAVAGMQLGMGDIGYLVPAEFDSTLYHKKGALAAARNNNPQKSSSGCQFYIVQGRKYSDEELNMMEINMGIKFSAQKRMTYKMLGGTPQLDMAYTVFGEVESGLEVVDKIAMVPKDGNNRPYTDIRMRMELLK